MKPEAKVRQAAARVERSQAKLDQDKADLEAAVIALRIEEEWSMARIGELIGFTAPGIHKMLRRHGVK
jgi:hypothetical protein